jgi:hypothetical protein
MQALAPYPGFRRLLLALVVVAVVGGTSPRAGAQEDPSRSPTLSLAGQGQPYLCAPVDPQASAGQQYLCALVDPQASAGHQYLCGPVALSGSPAASLPSAGRMAAPSMMRKCWVDDNGITSCCTGTWCCSYIDGIWWCG